MIMEKLNLTLTKDEWKIVKSALLDLVYDCDLNDRPFLHDEALYLYSKVSSLLSR